MIWPTWAKPAAAVALLAAAFACGWTAQGWRKGADIESIKAAQASSVLAETEKAIGRMAGFQKGIDDALQQFQSTSAANANAQQDLGRSLLELRGITAGLRGDFAGLPERIRDAAAPALAEYASTCTAVFESMAAGGGRLAEAGAGIAREAEGHAADARLIHEAWPSASQAER